MKQETMHPAPQTPPNSGRPQRPDDSRAATQRGSALPRSAYPSNPNHPKARAAQTGSYPAQAAPRGAQQRARQGQMDADTRQFTGVRQRSPQRPSQPSATGEPRTRSTAFYRSALRRRRQAQRLLGASVLLVAVLVACIALLRGCAGKAPAAPEESLSQNSTAQAAPSLYVLPTKPPFIIAMDAGHGGDDVGATGLVNEVELTETTLYHLNGWLKNDENYIPVLSREAGEGKSIADRAQAAVDSGAHLLLSVHGNSSSDPTVQGFECFPTPPGRTYYAPSLRFGLLLAQGMGTAGNHLRGENGVRYAYYENGGQEEKTIIEASDDTPRNAQSFGLLERAPCPAVLVEQCFLTNETDVSVWAGEAGCAHAARVYYEAICAYFGTEPLPPT